MRTFGAVVVTTLLIILSGSLRGQAAPTFDTGLAGDKLAAHVLNRAAFGPRPGDIDEIKRIGVEAWIRRQLRPDQLAENPALAPKLKTLVSLSLPTWQIFETFQTPQPSVRIVAPNPQQILGGQMQQFTTGSPEQRKAILATLTADARRQLLASAPRQYFDGLPELQQESDRARQIEEEVRNRMVQEQQRKLRPPLAELLTPEQARDVQRGTTEEKLAVLRSLDREKRTLVFRSLQVNLVPDEFRREALAATNPTMAVGAELVEARLQRALHSSHQLEEVLVDFWLNHFNVFNGKGPVRMLLTSYERDAIRPHVLGRFRDMLAATARHPAMLFYLDNHQSQAPRDANPAAVIIVNGATRPGLNENYARELMELHTLGVDGGYTQADVVDVARAFTGWTIFDPNRVGEFYFNPAMHDRGEKVILGKAIARGGGENEGAAILDQLARHPSTARFISFRLAQRFVADDPPKALVDRMAATFTRTDGDLRFVMETLLLSREFLSEEAYRSKMKSPLEMVLSALRAVGADVTDTTALAQRLTDLGQPLYGRVDPAGYPNTSESWANSAGLLGRMNFASALMTGQISGVAVNTDRMAATDVRRLYAQLIGVDPPAESVNTLTRAVADKPLTPAILGTVLLSSPDFQKR